MVSAATATFPAAFPINWHARAATIILLTAQGLAPVIPRWVGGYLTAWCFSKISAAARKVDIDRTPPAQTRALVAWLRFLHATGAFALERVAEQPQGWLMRRGIARLEEAVIDLSDVLDNFFFATSPEFRQLLDHAVKEIEQREHVQG